MSGICDTCQRNQVCRRPMDGMDSCRLYVSGKESNYKKLFGTPERAARTLQYALDCKDSRLEASCGLCPLFGGCTDRDASDDALLEWLVGDA